MAKLSVSTSAILGIVLMIGPALTSGDTLYKDKTAVDRGYGRVVGGTVYWRSCSGGGEITYKKPPYWVDKGGDCGGPGPSVQVRWHGTLLRFSKDTSSIDVRKGTIERKIYFDSSTKWTRGTKTIEMSEFKDGSDVICLGKYDEKGDYHATRIDLRRR
jgi:hypothetical protein